MRYFDLDGGEINQSLYDTFVSQGKSFHSKRFIENDKRVEGVFQFTIAEQVDRDAKQVASDADLTNRKMDVVRRKREQMLIASDYHASSDRSMSEPMTAYRQELRDITSQNVDALLAEWREREVKGFTLWPTKPE